MGRRASHVRAAVRLGSAVRLRSSRAHSPVERCRQEDGRRHDVHVRDIRAHGQSLSRDHQVGTLPGAQPRYPDNRAQHRHERQRGRRLSGSGVLERVLSYGSGGGNEQLLQRNELGDGADRPA